VADLAITAANVVVVGTPVPVMKSGYAAVAIVAGQAVYLDTVTNTVKLSKADTDISSQVDGIALNTAAAGQPVWYITGGTVSLGTVLTVGKLYVLSGAAAGGIAPAADLAAGWRTTLLGIAVTSSQLLLVLNVTKVTNP
jgi:hypothetical protein